MEPSRSLRPSGWNKPLAIRCQVNPADKLSSPETIQTSPSHEQTAIRLPSGRKSKPVNRSWAFQGLRSGKLNVSTANGPSFFPNTTEVWNTSGHRFGPPSVSGLSGRGGVAVLAYFERE